MASVNYCNMWNMASPHVEYFRTNDMFDPRTIAFAKDQLDLSLFADLAINDLLVSSSKTSVTSGVVEEPKAPFPCHQTPNCCHIVASPISRQCLSFRHSNSDVSSETTDTGQLHEAPGQHEHTQQLQTAFKLPSVFVVSKMNKACETSKYA